MAKCIVCGAKADLLCDHHLGWERLRGQMEKEVPNLALLKSAHVPVKYRKIHTCDAPLCSACAVRGGISHFRLRYSGSFSETIDYCPGHADFGTLLLEISGLKADAIRAEWRDMYRRKREREQRTQTQPDLFGG